jgi:hypothetical protein
MPKLAEQTAVLREASGNGQAQYDTTRLAWQKDLSACNISSDQHTSPIQWAVASSSLSGAADQLPATQTLKPKPTGEPSKTTGKTAPTASQPQLRLRFRPRAAPFSCSPVSSPPRPLLK